MSSLYQRGYDIYKNEGLVPLAQKGSRFVLNWAASLPLADDLAYRLSTRRLSRQMESEADLDDILDTAFEYRGYGRYRLIRPMQVRSEFAELVETVAERNPDTVMEIGTANGGTFYTWCRHLDSASTVLSLDLPGGDFGGGYTREKTRFFERFAPDKNLVFVRADSHDRRTLQRVREELPDESVDFLFIDGDHRYEGVKQDFEMYGQLVADDGLIAFHDIVEGPRENVGGVPEFWRELKPEYDTHEIVADRDQQDGYGIGLVYQ